jgi:hypothetical protein
VQRDGSRRVANGALLQRSRSARAEDDGSGKSGRVVTLELQSCLAAAARDESASVRRRFEVMALNFHRATGKWSVFACNPRAYSLLARGAPR